MTGQQRFAFVGAAFRMPEALAWYDHLKRQRGIRPLVKQEFEHMLQHVCDFADQLPDGCRLKDEATLQIIAGIPDPEEATEFFKVCFCVIHVL